MVRGWNSKKREAGDGRLSAGCVEVVDERGVERCLMKRFIAG